MSRTRQRLERLEKATGEPEIEVIVNWEENPGPAPEGVTVIRWSGDEDRPELDLRRPSENEEEQDARTDLA